MPLRDHYRTLGVRPKASLQEIKKAFRSLAHKYHPDKNPENPFSLAQFRKLQEAYEVLSDEKARKLYDEERYFAGLSARKEPEHIDTHWLVSQAQRLRDHMAKVDSYRMNHKALSDYLRILLSDEHIAILHQENERQNIAQLTGYVIESVRNLHYSLYPPILFRLRLIAQGDEDLLGMIRHAERSRKSRMTNDWILPIVIVIITAVLCLFMYLYSRKA